MDRIFIYGAGSVGKMAVQIIKDMNKQSKKWNIIGILDDDKEKWGTEFSGYSVLGGEEYLHKLDDGKIVIGFSSPKLKKVVSQKIEQSNLELATLIHPLAWLAEKVKVGEGTIIYPGVCIDVEVQIGKHATINKHATFGHDSTYGDFITISPGVNLGGFLEVGDGCEFGIGASTVQNLNIGEWTTIGAGSVIIKDLPPNCTAVGVPAKPIKFHHE
jgi:sugar O-acyltransferase (sialic acid O-acetyltransferase NeuD family)